MAKNEAPCEIVVLGASYAGASTAHYLLRHALPSLPASASARVTLVSSSSEMLCRPACPRAMLADEFFDQNKLFVSVPASFEQYPKERFRFIQGTANHVDHIRRSVTVRTSDGSSETLDFYALVVATGANTPSPLHGLNTDNASLKADWKTFRAALSKAKNIVVAGGGPTGVETAGELGEYLNGRAGMFSNHLENPKVKITLVTAGKQLLPQLRPALAAKAEQLLAKVGVTVVKNVRVVSVTPEEAGTVKGLTSHATLSLGDGTTLDADLYIPTTGTKANSSFMDASLLQSDGRIETNPKTLRVDKAGERIYAVGDVASYARPAVHLILNAVPIVSGNIKHDLLRAYGTSGQAFAEKEYKDDTSETQLVPVGKSKGVGAAMGWRLPSFFVWLIKGRDYWVWTTGNLWSGKQWAKES